MRMARSSSIRREIDKGPPALDNSIMVLAETRLTYDPAWPWSLPGIGLPLLAGVAFLLIGLTVWTYLGSRGSNVRRMLCVLFLRLGALLVACFLVLRPSLAEQDDENALPSKLLILIDKSESMNFGPEFDSKSRWESVRRILDSGAVRSALEKLRRDRRVEVVFYQGAEDVTRFDPDGKADGKHTDIGQWLNKLLTLHGKDADVRGLVMFTDGADNGTRFPTLEQAAAWHGTCPIHVFAVGSPNATRDRNDIAFLPNKIFVDPNPAHVKGKLTVKAFANAPGFENAKVNVSLLINDKLATPVQSVILRKTHENEIKMECDAPVTPGEIKVTLKIEPKDGELSRANNEISTFATVIKEGVSILWVEGRLRLEATWAMRALVPDQRFRVHYTKRLKEAKATPAKTDWYEFGKRKYDVIVIGDISASRFADGDPDIFQKIHDMVVKEGAGLLMLGGRDTFLNGEWQAPAASKLAELLPVRLTARERSHLDDPVRLSLPPDKEPGFLLTLANDPTKNKQLFAEVFDALNGMTILGRPYEVATQVLATNNGREPILVSADRGKGRSLAFGAEDTYRAWTRAAKESPGLQKDKAAVTAYQRFWRQVMLWLAHQEQADGSIRVLPDVRRISADTQAGLGFTVEKIEKGGLPDKNARFKVKAIGPNKEEFEVPTSKEDGKERGFVQGAKTAGEWRIVASVEGSKEKPGEAKFLVFSEDLESLRPAADHDFLRKLAQAGRGKFHLADEQKFAAFLDELRVQQTEAAKPKLQLWPDWRRNPASDSVSDQLETLWNSTALACFLLFSVFLCLEWFLRRRWGMV
jgi:uncharacterized membrane protein